MPSSPLPNAFDVACGDRRFGIDPPDGFPPHDTVPCRQTAIAGFEARVLALRAATAAEFLASLAAAERGEFPGFNANLAARIGEAILAEEDADHLGNWAWAVLRPLVVAGEMTAERAIDVVDGVRRYVCSVRAGLAYPFPPAEFAGEGRLVPPETPGTCRGWVAGEAPASRGLGGGLFATSLGERTSIAEFDTDEFDIGCRIVPRHLYKAYRKLEALHLRVAEKAIDRGEAVYLRARDLADRLDLLERVRRAREALGRLNAPLAARAARRVRFSARAARLLLNPYARRLYSLLRDAFPDLSRRDAAGWVFRNSALVFAAHNARGSDVLLSADVVAVPAAPVEHPYGMLGIKRSQSRVALLYSRASVPLVVSELGSWGPLPASYDEAIKMRKRALADAMRHRRAKRRVDPANTSDIKRLGQLEGFCIEEAKRFGEYADFLLSREAQHARPERGVSLCEGLPRPRVRRSDRRLCSGRPAGARRRRSGVRSGTRAGPGLGDDPEPARAGLHCCLRGARR